MGGTTKISAGAFAVFFAARSLPRDPISQIPVENFVRDFSVVFSVLGSVFPCK